MIVSGRKISAALLLATALIASAKAYFNDVQLKDMKYDPVLTAADKPAIYLNADLMQRLRPQMEKFYYDPGKYSSYLEQLGITYPGTSLAQ